MTFSDLREISSCETIQDEYWYHVASQEEMPLAGTTRPPRLLADLDSIYPTSDSYEPGSLTKEAIANLIFDGPDIAEQLRLVLSLSDKRFYLDLSFRFSRALVRGQEPASTVCGCLPNTMKKHSTSALLNMVRIGTEDRRRTAAETIARYLIGKGLLVVLDLYFGLDPVRRTAINDLWLAPHDVQQNETKRRGHGAEAEIAKALKAAGVSVIPVDKDTAPMGAADPNVSLETFAIAPRRAGETVSADIAVLDAAGQLQLMIMGLVQSSDPGQFGVDKAATNGRIRERLDQYRARTGSTLELWGIVDGIGYAENPSGTINPMLQHFDFFVQHNSAYKAILGAGRLGLCQPVAILYDPGFYDETTRSQMHDRYGYGADLIEDPSEAPPQARPVSAGRATVWVT